MENKRGQGMSTSTIVLLIIGVIILVVLIIGFTKGWSTFGDWLKSNNIDSIKNSCGVACSTASQYEFCSVRREVKDGENPKFEATCEQLSTLPKFEAYGIEPCPDLC